MTKSLTKENKKIEVRRDCNEIALVKISVFIQCLRRKKTVLSVSYVLHKRAHKNVPTTIIH